MVETCVRYAYELGLHRVEDAAVEALERPLNDSPAQTWTAQEERRRA